MGDIAIQQHAIPIIEFGPLLQDDCPSEKFAAIGKEIFEAFRDFDFAYIKNHSVPQNVVDEAFQWSQRFFALPQSEKDKVPHPSAGWYHRGYSGIGREKVSQMVFDEEGIANQRKMPDFKESYEMGAEGKLRHIWPAGDVIPGFREFFTQFYEICYGMEVKLLRAIAVGMGLEEDFFTNYHQTKQNQIRLLHYPPAEEELLATGKLESISAHTDFGTLTMLFQDVTHTIDQVGGLEVEDIHERGKFNPAHYIQGTMVVNIGDLLMRWSNDVLRSTLHHVRTPPADAPLKEGEPRMTRERYSIPYFVAPDIDSTIDCMPGCWGPERPKKYEPINSSEYTDMRLNATY
ncbi:flavonol synthase/flavanone 3-hydroxylase [Metarhizium acridum CQMa 102]|uniref:Flavonol synthase/flavanone 3-hydroxylase n=1 Tax=Metarhizium acridum (strain CQMa 102) TaxID=655827 RepID=E9E0A2_METAQ|nr:flavonol synthase/flavanone 3-hydroxylase [Metarhizium acridum CQMa 102]EFY90703.1 flavonol synthase/flavanone 3-hydroxylase [Metarhizium acridum CQMa 102]